MLGRNSWQQSISKSPKPCPTYLSAEVHNYIRGKGAKKGCECNHGLHSHPAFGSFLPPFPDREHEVFGVGSHFKNFVFLMYLIRTDNSPYFDWIWIIRSEILLSSLQLLEKLTYLTIHIINSNRLVNINKSDFIASNGSK